MNILIEKSEESIRARVPKRMKTFVLKCAAKMNINESQYIKLAITERLEKDLNKKL